jgi:hypothetical protein
MINKIRNNPEIFLIVIASMLLTILIGSIPFNEYEVKIHFCDGREPKTKIVRSVSKPSNKNINTERSKTYPTAFDEINVCDIELIK